MFGIIRLLTLGLLKLNYGIVTHHGLI
ncbi:hypothetical protein MCP1_280018 [Candidatus Terasakiella magnetica]|nr:hypothetical protein MCP1_280018 [Candidatus Terasakiella magnetica]